MTHQFDTQAFVRRMEAAGMARAVAEELADALGSVVLNGLSTRRDVTESTVRLESQLRETAKELELRLTLRVGGIIVAATTLIVALIGTLIAFK